MDDMVKWHSVSLTRYLVSKIHHHLFTLLSFPEIPCMDYPLPILDIVGLQLSLYAHVQVNTDARLLYSWMKAE